jgi:hypothetical protein
MAKNSIHGVSLNLVFQRTHKSILLLPFETSKRGNNNNDSSMCNFKQRFWDQDSKSFAVPVKLFATDFFGGPTCLATRRFLQAEALLLGLRKGII